MKTTTEFESRRIHKARQNLGSVLLQQLDMDEDSLCAVTGAAPEGIREALVVAAELGEAKHALAVQESQAEEAPGHCENQACKDWVQSEGTEEVPCGEDGLVSIRLTGRRSFCDHGGPFATDCLFRMREPPPSRLDSASCQPIPEWAEAVRMLRRLGELEPDEFGKYSGTDMALKENIRVVWWALVELLVETGKVQRSWIEEGRPDHGDEARRAKELLGMLP